MTYFVSNTKGIQLSFFCLQIHHPITCNQLLPKPVHSRVWTCDLTCFLSMRTGGEQPIPLWNEPDTSADADKPKILLYSLSLMFKVSLVLCLSTLKSKDTWNLLHRASLYFWEQQLALVKVLKANIVDNSHSHFGSKPLSSYIYKTDCSIIETFKLSFDVFSECCVLAPRGSRWQPPLLPCVLCALRPASSSSSCPTGSSARLSLGAAAATWSCSGSAKWISTWLWDR